MHIFSLSQVCHRTGFSVETLQVFLEREWISPPGPLHSESQMLDHEDLARILLIKDLQHDLGVNDEAIPIILHLIDQLHCLRGQMTKK